MIYLQKGRNSWWDFLGVALGYMMVRIVTSELVKNASTASAG